MTGGRFLSIAVRKSEIAARGPLVPASRAPSDDRSGKPTELGVLSRQYPITDCYVNSTLQTLISSQDAIKRRIRCVLHRGRHPSYFPT